MNNQLFDFVTNIKAARHADDVGKGFIQFADAMGAVNTHMFMETGAAGFRATTVPWMVLEEEIFAPNFSDSRIVDLVREGAASIHWGVDVDKSNPEFSEFDRHVSRERFLHLGQRNSVTFPMPDTDGAYRGAGVGIGFSDNGRSYRNLMREREAVLATASFAAHSRIQILVAQKAGQNPLSARQKEILTLLASGLKRAAIADRLGISDSTTNMHLTHLRKKLNAKTTEQALAIALTESWIAP